MAGWEEFADVATDVIDGAGGAFKDFGSVPTSPGGGWWDSVKSGLSGFGDVAKQILPAAQVAGAGYGIYSGIQGARQLADQTKLAESASKRQGQISSDAAGFGRAAMDRASQGQIAPAVQQQIDNWAKGAKQQARAKAAQMGQGDSTMLAQWEAWIDQQAQAMQAGYLQQEEQLGLQAYGVAGQAAGSQAGGAAGQQGSLEAMIAEANRVLARLSQAAA